MRRWDINRTLTLIRPTRREGNPSVVYSEMRIGNTTYRLTSKFEGSKKLGEALKTLAIRRASKLTG